MANYILVCCDKETGDLDVKKFQEPKSCFDEAIKQYDAGNAIIGFYGTQIRFDKGLHFAEIGGTPRRIREDSNINFVEGFISNDDK